MAWHFEAAAARQPAQRNSLPLFSVAPSLLDSACPKPYDCLGNIEESEKTDGGTSLSRREARLAEGGGQRQNSWGDGNDIAG